MAFKDLLKQEPPEDIKESIMFSNDEPKAILRKLQESDIISKDLNMISESTNAKLRDVARVGTKMSDADFYITRRGTIDAVGQVTDEYNPESFGVKVTRTDVIIPQYLKYLLMFKAQSGYWKDNANGTLKLVNIRKDDVLDIPLT